MDKLTSWVYVSPDSDFTIYNLPYGIFTENGSTARIGVAIGDYVLDLYAMAELGHFQDFDINQEVFRGNYLNDFISLGKNVYQQVRQKLQQLLDEKNENLKPYASQVLIPMHTVKMQMPVQVGDYTDFYSSEEHAINVGTMFRGPENALMPNWKHMPIAYHGRASSIVVSGTPIHRPKGQTKPKDSENPVFGPTQALDFELEMAFVIGKSTELGNSITTTEAEDHIFGLCLFNDWSARDVQRWEYVPLGPFLGKNFASSISPWIVPLEALEPFRIAGPAQIPEVLPYLKFEGKRNFDINLEVSIQPKGNEEHIITQSNIKYLYWNMCQQLAHHTVNGCNVRVGDMMASGTISGKDKSAYGSLLELTWGGTRPVKMHGNTERIYLKDEDTVIMRGYAEKNGIRVGFGEVRTQILPAL